MIRRLAVAFTVILSLLAAGATPAAQAPPWDGEPFAADADRMLAAAAEVPVDEDHGVQALLEEGRFVVDETGRVEHRFRLVYRVDAESAVDSWSRVSRGWSTWYQERPTIEARVITAAGVEHRLDPGDIGEYSDGEQGPDLYSDSMILSGPLPAVGVGSIVEEVHHVRGTRPFFEEGTVDGFVFGRTVPVRTARAIVEVPESLPFRYETYRLDGAVVEESREEGRLEVRIEAGPLEPFESDAAYAPGDVARRPMMQFSTAPSWQAIAAAYDRIVNERIAAADVGKIVKKATRTATRPEERIDALLQFLHDQVRYTGVEFGERSLVPADPTTTLERRFGDCKDTSTLLVALLREAEVEAHVAPLDTGPGFDVDPDLPGMGGFDHAIVRVGGDSPLWIDPTHPYSRAGLLPDADQNRLALIASPTTRGLTRTPKAAPGDNVRRETRRAVFADDGAGTIVETTRVTGAFDLEYRSAFDKQSETERRERLEGYVESHYMAEALGDVEMTDAADTAVPFELTLEATESARIVTTPTQAVIYLNSPAVLSDLPRVLSPDDDGDEDRDDSDRRRFPVELPRPYVAEHVYLIEPPPGYEVVVVPDDERVQLGPAEYSRSVRRGDDGTLEVTMRFDTGTGLYTADEAEAVTDALRDFYEGDLPSVQLQETGEAHLAAGRIGEALAAFRGLVERFPDSAVQRAKVARAYLAAGLGAEARRELERAVELEPDSLVGQRTRGLVLAHDLLGRKFYPGMDHAGAERAFRRALEIEPDDFAARGELSILLEHAADGERYAADARLDEALDILRSIRVDLKNENLVHNELVALFRAGRHAEVIELWESIGQDANRGAVLLAALAAHGGVQAAFDKAAELTDRAEVRRGMLLAAGDLLAAERYYADAATMIEASARGADDSVARLSRANLLRRFRHHERHAPSRDEPAGFAIAFLLSTVDLAMEGEGGERFRQTLCPELRETFDRDAAEMLESEFNVASAGVNSVQGRDSIVSLFQSSVEGVADSGHAVRMTMPGQPSPVDLYLLDRDGAMCVIGGTDGLDPLGRWLLEEIDAGRLDVARSWLDRVADDTYDGSATLALRHPVQFLWPGGMADAATCRLAAAALLTEARSAERIASILLPAREAAESPEVRTGIDLALLRHAQEIDDHEIVVETTERLLEAHPREIDLVVARLGALMRLRRFDQALAEVDERLERRPREQMLLNAKTDMLMESGQLEAFRALSSELIDSGAAPPPIYNNLAWVDVALGEVDDETIRIAEQGVSLTQFQEPASLHTLATAYAEVGRVADARDVLMALLELRPSSELEHYDWYILGRIAEHFGVEHAALDAYGRVELDDDREDDGLTTYAMAQRALRRVGGERDVAAAGER